MRPPRKRNTKVVQALANLNARASTAAGPYAEVLLQGPRLVSTSPIARSAVECGAGGPLAGLSSDQILKTSDHSAAIRAGTVHDGQFQHSGSNQSYLPSGMVDPHSQRSLSKSLAEAVA